MTAGPAEERVRGTYGRDWSFAARGNEIAAAHRGGGVVLSGCSWEVLERRLYGTVRDALRAAVTGRHRP